MRQSKPVKPLIKDYKKALSVLAGHLDIELKYTKSGSLSIESVGYLKGWYRVSIQGSVQDVLEAMVEELKVGNVSATDIALYFRNEREEIKNEAQRIDVVSRVSSELGFILLDGIQPAETDFTSVEPEAIEVEYGVVEDDREERLVELERRAEHNYRLLTDPVYEKQWLEHNNPFADVEDLLNTEPHPNVYLHMGMSVAECEALGIDMSEADPSLEYKGETEETKEFTWS